MITDLIYIGTSIEAVIFLLSNKNFKVIKIFCDKKRITPELKEISYSNKIELCLFNDLNNLKKLILNCSTKLIFFIYQLDLLIPKLLTDKYKFYNVHRGSLKNNRGPTPESWSIILGEKFTETSLHIIDERIDAGILIKATKFNIPEGSNISDLRLIHHSRLPILIEALYDHLNKKIKGYQIPITNKGYRPWVQESDVTINFSKDSLKTFKNKFLSQHGYKGIIVIIQNVKYYINNYLEYEDYNFNLSKNDLKEVVLIKKTNTNLLIYWNKRIFLLYINNKSEPTIPKKMPAPKSKI